MEHWEGCCGALGEKWSTGRGGALREKWSTGKGGALEGVEHWEKEHWEGGEGRSVGRGASISRLKSPLPNMLRAQPLPMLQLKLIKWHGIQHAAYNQPCQSLSSNKMNSQVSKSELSIRQYISIYCNYSTMQTRSYERLEINLTTDM